MPDIAVSVPNMTTAQAEFGSTVTQCNGINSTVTATTGALRVAFTGDVATRFQKVMTEWETNFTRVTTALSNMEQLLGTSIANYTRNDQTQGATVDALAAQKPNF